jgi:hypothetical protein
MRREFFYGSILLLAAGIAGKVSLSKAQPAPSHPLVTAAEYQRWQT